jgi:type II secretory pathway pseudopilin PulG
MLTKRKAFTVIELMLVIGVLVILIAIVVWGLKGAAGTGADKATRTTLQNLTSMSEELYRKNKLAGFEGPVADKPIYPIPGPGPSLPMGGELAPRDVTDATQNNDRRGDAVARTGEVIRRLSSLPDNKKALEKFPSDQVLLIKLTRSSPPYTDGPGKVILDGWRNPILFVPPTGLAHVFTKQKDTYTGGNFSRGARVIHNGEYWTAIASTNSSPGGTGWFQGIASSDGHGFWASAGPDGVFSDGDDNIYSFEQ